MNLLSELWSLFLVSLVASALAAWFMSQRPDVSHPRRWCSSRATRLGLWLESWFSNATRRTGKGGNDE